MHQLTAQDWSWIIGFLLVAFGLALYHSRKSSQSIEDYFIAGKNTPWWILGTSIVATTFAAGAPILKITPKEKLNFIWHKPWTRPERFAYETGLTMSLPTGWARFWSAADYREFAAKRLSSMLEKGFREDLPAKSILEPLRVRR